METCTCSRLATRPWIPQGLSGWATNLSNSWSVQIVNKGKPLYDKPK